MYELHLTIKLFTTLCLIFIHISSRIRGILDRCNLLIVSNTTQLYNIWMLKYQTIKELRILWKFVPNIIPIIVCALAWKLLSRQNFEHKFLQKWRGKNSTDLKMKCRIKSVFSQWKMLENRRWIINVCQCVYCSKGKVWPRLFIYHSFLWITGFKTNMLLITFLGLIAILKSVSGDCEIGTKAMNNFNFTKVGICVLIWFLFLELIFRLFPLTSYL